MGSHSFIPTEGFNVAVVGGGIGGLCLALGLAKHNVQFQIYEAAHKFAEIGAGVGFGPNAQQAMHLINPLVKEGYDRHATLNYDEDKKDVYFSFRMGMDGKGRTKHLKEGDLISEPGGEGRGINICHRAKYLEELIALLPPDCANFGKRVDEMENLGNGVRLHFHDGTTAEASAVIGCDGIKSKVRRILFGKETDALFTGKFAYRGLLPMDKAIDVVGEKLARNSQMYIGYNGHVLTTQVELGQIMNVVAFQTKADGKWENDKWVLPMRREEMEQEFSGWSDTVKNILNLMEQPDLWALYDHGPIDSFWKGRVCLMGDAAHASTPHQGSGAGMAMEDAYLLSSLIGQTHKADELEAAFAAYDHVRRPRDLKLVTTSREAGELYEFQGEGIEDDVKKIDEKLKVMYEWIWGENLEDEFTEAMKIFNESRKIVVK